jgi:hypothetical protein
MTNKEYIICAAIWYQDGVVRASQPRNVESGIVVGGWRHFNCIITLKTMFYDVWQECERCNKKRIDVLNNDIQGFLTSRGNFVDRVEGLKIAKENNQLLHPDTHRGTDLYSEDLY